MKKAVFVCLPLILCGCSNYAMFATKTSVGVDFDSKPATAAIGVDRAEGWVGPREDAGGIPAAVAALQSDGRIFGASVRQLYATGNAALTLSEEHPSPREDEPLSGQRELMFFGTNTTIGLKIGFTSQMPDSFVFGYKRKEFSYIPLGTKTVGTQTVDVYPSVLASIDTTAAAAVSPAGAPSADLSDTQFFATGGAANRLALRPDIRDLFRARTDETLRNYYRQGEGAAHVLSCYTGVAPSDLPVIWEDARLNRLYGATSPAPAPAGAAPAPGDDLLNREDAAAQQIYGILQGYQQKAFDAGGAVVDQKSLVSASRLYSATLTEAMDEADADRLNRLDRHADLVCALARRNR